MEPSAEHRICIPQAGEDPLDHAKHQHAYPPGTPTPSVLRHGVQYVETVEIVGNAPGAAGPARRRVLHLWSDGTVTWDITRRGSA